MEGDLHPERRSFAVGSCIRLSCCAVALVGCGRLGFGDVVPTPDATGDAIGVDAPGLAPIHRYALAGTLADDYGGPALVDLGGTFVAGGYQFAANQGLRLDNAMPPTAYTVDLAFTFDQLTSWRKILDFDSLTQDTGLYTYESALQFVIVPEADFVTAQPTLTAGVQIHATLTRDAAGSFTAYLDGAPVLALRDAAPDPPATPPATSFAFADDTAVAALGGATAYFFTDDTTTTGGEASSGVARAIRIYEGALTPAQVAAIQ